MTNNIHIIADNITNADVDIIVCAANNKLIAGGGVCGAIHKAAGAKLTNECLEIESIDGVRCPAGKAKYTSAGNLNAKYVIHTVGPHYLLNEQPQALLKSAYESTLDLALTLECMSIAFPALSCGVYKYPATEASIIAMKECSKYKYSTIEIYFYIITRSIHESWTDAKEALGKTT